MVDVHKLASKSGLISSGAAGFLKGVASRQREDRESQASREKDALSAFIELRKDGWTVGDESKGISGGEGIHLEGFGILVPPEVEGTSALDLAKIGHLGSQSTLYEAQARKADRNKPKPEFKALENVQGQWTLHKYDPTTGQWIDTGKKAQAPGVDTKKFRVTSPDGKREFYAQSKEELNELLKTKHTRGWGKTRTDSGIVKAMALSHLTTLRGRRSQLLDSIKNAQSIASMWTGSEDVKKGKEPPARIAGQLELIERVEREVERIDNEAKLIMGMVGGVVPEVEGEKAPPWIDEETLKLYETVYGMSRDDVIALVNKQLKSKLRSTGPKFRAPIVRND